MVRAKEIGSLDALAKTLQTTLGIEATHVRSLGETLVPPPVSANTDVREIIAALPRLRTDSTGGSAPDLRIGPCLGEGGMGVVRSAEQVTLGRQVAVKALKPEVEVERATLQILREAWVTGWLEHPNVVPIYALGTDASGTPMIVMKKIDGTPWSAFLRGEATVPNESKDALEWHLQILIQVTNAVQFASSRGIVHRDLKPDNIMIGRFGEVYVLDWGIAVSLHDDANGRLPLAKNARGIAGTPGYMAPEMVEESAETLSERTDVYLLGAILHEIITGVVRHKGKNLVETLFSSMRSEPFDYGDEVPSELAAIANKAMSREPNDRHATAEEVRIAVLDFLRHRSSAALTEETLARLHSLEKMLGSKEATEIAVYNALSECRFGFAQALRTWPENSAARDGLHRALHLTAHYEIGRGSHAAASVLVAELGERADPDLRVRLDSLRQALEAKELEVAKLKKMSADRDLEIGRRTRAFLSTAMAFQWGLGPLGLGLGQKYLDFTPTYGWYFAIMAAVAAEMAVAVYWARYSLFRTSVNRQILAAVLLTGAGGLITKIAGCALGLSLELTLLFDLALCVMVTAMSSISIDRRLWPGPFIFLAGFLAACFDFKEIYFIVAGSTFIAYICAAVIWRPKSWADFRAPVGD